MDNKSDTLETSRAMDAGTETLESSRSTDDKADPVESSLPMDDKADPAESSLPMDDKADPAESSSATKYQSDAFESSRDMEKVASDLFRVGGLLGGFPPTICPSLDDFEFLQYAQQPLKPTVGNFRILMNVHLFEPHEIEIHVLGKKVVEIRGRHEKRQNADGLWLSRECVFTYDLPSEVIGYELQAEWYQDNYLVIKPTPAKCEEDCDKVRLVPKHLKTSLKPGVEISIIKEMLENIRDRAMVVLRYIRSNTLQIPPPPTLEGPKQQQQHRLKVEQQKSEESPSSALGSSISPDGTRTSSSDKDCHQNAPVIA